MKRSCQARRGRRVLGAWLILCGLGCGRRGPTAHEAQDEYVADAAAFTNNTADDVRALLRKGPAALTEEWEIWEHRGPMTPARIAEFYKHTSSPIFELGAWHLWRAEQRAADLALVEDLRARYASKTILDVGDGTGLTAIPLARAGLDVTLADLDSNALRFGVFRAERHAVRLRSWRIGFDPAPPAPTYDVILVRDLLDPFPRDQLDAMVDQLIQRKHAGTQVIVSSPTGAAAQHLLRLDADDHVKQLSQRLQTELPRP